MLENVTHALGEDPTAKTTETCKTTLFFGNA